MRRLAAALHGPDDPRQRLLAASAMVNCVGMGLFLSAGTIYLIRSAGLRPSVVGLGLRLGAFVGLGAGILFGDQADRRGAREVVIASMFLEAVASCLLLAVDSMWSLALVSAVAAIGRAGSGSGRGALIGILAEEGEGARLRTYLRAVTNVGLAIGTVGAAVVLAVDTRAGYATMLLVDATTFVVAAGIIARLPHLPPTRASVGQEEDGTDARRWIALRDAPYLALTVASSIAALQYFVLTEAVPLWVTLHTNAPRWIAAILFLLAALIVAALQVPATRSIVGPQSAARLLARSGPLFLVAWLLIAETSGRSAALAIAVLLVAIALHSLAEVWQAAGTFELSFALAQPEAHGQYQGVFGLSMGLAEAFAPALVIALCISWGKPGWLVLGAVVTVAGMACVLVERYAAAQRPPVAVEA
ncbi:MAG: transporter [Conexibacter sp.]|nr:transporter [Conexibacter sp.]